MIKSSHRRRISLTIGVAFMLNIARVCSAADAKPVVFPPLQIFKDFCTDGSWSLDDLAQLAGQRHFALISSEDVPTPDGGPAHKLVWQADTAIGPIGVVVVAAESKSQGYTESCTVTTPLNSADFVRTWLTGSLGEPTSTEKKEPDATEIHWAQASAEMKLDVILLTSVPDKKYALISVMKHLHASKHS